METLVCCPVTLVNNIASKPASSNKDSKVFNSSTVCFLFVNDFSKKSTLLAAIIFLCSKASATFFQNYVELLYWLS